VWRRAHDRFRRAVDRYHQVLERIESLVSDAPAQPAGGRGDVPAPGADPLPPPARVDAAGAEPHPPAPVAADVAALHRVGGDLAAMLGRVHDVCLAAQNLSPSDGEDIPPGPGAVLLDVHRALARSATLVAQAAESLTMVLVTLQAGRPDEATVSVLGAGRAAEQASVHIARAEALVQRSSRDDGG
jgi:hypothetical protein